MNINQDELDFARDTLGPDATDAEVTKLAAERARVAAAERPMMYAAMTHLPGCLPDTAEELPTFETVAEAWTYLADSLSEAEAYTLEDEDDESGPSRRSDLALALEEHARVAADYPHLSLGTVYGPDDYCYSVEVSEDEEV